MPEFEDTFRVVTFVPEAAAESFADRVTEHIPAFLGHYDKVAWWSEPGTEQFRALEGAGPVSGKIGQICREASVRIEFSVPADEAFLQRFIAEAILPCHPWEEPVILVAPQRIMRHGK